MFLFTQNLYSKTFTKTLVILTLAIIFYCLESKTLPCSIFVAKTAEMMN